MLYSSAEIWADYVVDHAFHWQYKLKHSILKRHRKQNIKKQQNLVSINLSNETDEKQSKILKCKRKS